ncbi:MAG TPA: hypothetical protein VE820_11490 [Sphingomicrobium sp.]|jgi:opacity protein-like surface antigen|nr:hypothetical protein [Sphingomicrobium sp.]
MKALASLLAAAVLAATPASSSQFEANAQAQGVIDNIINGLIGNRYNVSERQAIRTCGWAAVRRAENDYRRYFSGSPHAYPGYRGYVRVAAITDVQRRTFVVRVKGLLDTARYGYRGGRNGADISFSCDVNGKGNVSNLKLQRNPWYRP